MDPYAYRLKQGEQQQMPFALSVNIHVHSFANTVIWCSLCARTAQPNRGDENKNICLLLRNARISGIKGFFFRSIHFSWSLALHQLKSTIARACECEKSRVNLPIDKFAFIAQWCLLNDDVIFQFQIDSVEFRILFWFINCFICCDICLWYVCSSGTYQHQ